MSSKGQRRASLIAMGGIQDKRPNVTVGAPTVARPTGNTAPRRESLVGGPLINEAGTGKDTGKDKSVSSESLHALAATQLATSVEFEAQIRNDTDFESRLGDALHARGADLASLMKEWDKNGDGVVRKMDFRLHCRKMILSAETSAIDAFFTKLDRDRSGTLDLREVKRALKTLQERAAEASTRASRALGMVRRYQERAQQAQHCAAACALAEQSEAKLLRLREAPGLEARLGALLLKRSAKMGDLVQKWDAGASKGDGVCRRDFAMAIKSLGVQAESTEVDALFTKLDVNSTGHLDVLELKRTLKSMHDAAANADGEALRTAKFVSELRKAFKASHAALIKAIAEDDLEAARYGEDLPATAEVAVKVETPHPKVVDRADGGSTHKRPRVSAARSSAGSSASGNSTSQASERQGRRS